MSECNHNNVFTECADCGNRLSIDMNYVHRIEWENAGLRSRIARLVEAGDKAMGDDNWIRSIDGVLYCAHCNNLVSNTFIPKCKHDTDCPVTLWQKAKEE